MQINPTKFLSTLFILLFLFSCSENDNEELYVPAESPVNYDLEAFPYTKLSDYNMFDGDLKNQSPVLGVIPYQPISSLFTDYAKKKRFIWMPDNVSANYISDFEVLDFPVGTIIVKTFYYDNVLPTNSTQIIETRLLIKKTTGWIFSEYVWNSSQTEAFIDNSGSNINIEWLEEGVAKSNNYRIPSESECLTCHKKSNISTPIGVKPQNLNFTYSYSSGTVNQLQKLIQEGYLNNTDLSSINSVIDWKDLSQPLELRARSYLDINCAHCHSDNTHCSYRPIRLSFKDTETSEDNIGICVIPDEDINSTLTHVVSPGRPERSVMSFRMNSINESTRMPLIGRNLVDDKAVTLINDWIDELTQVCN